jgi:hypothetical protein
MRLGSLVSAAVVTATAATAFAYMLSGGSLVKKAEEKRFELGASSVQATGTLTLTGAAATTLAAKLGRSAEGELSLPAVASYKMPGRCRLELAGANLPLPHPFATDRNGVLQGSDELKVAQTLFALVCPLLAARGGEESTHTIIDWAKRSGIDFTVTSLTRSQGAIAEVIGAEPREGTKPQLWIDKDNFVFLRVVLKKGAETYAVKLDPGAGILDAHPRTLELFSVGADGKDTLLLRFSAEKIEANAKLDDKLF